MRANKQTKLPNKGNIPFSLRTWPHVCLSKCVLFPCLLIIHIVIPGRTRLLKAKYQRETLQHHSASLQQSFKLREKTECKSILGWVLDSFCLIIIINYVHKNKSRRGYYSRKYGMHYVVCSCAVHKLKLLLKLLPHNKLNLKDKYIFLS